MKLKDLPENVPIASVKVKIPEELHKEAILSGLPVMEVYIYSNWMSGVWVKTDLKSSQIYPICGVRPSTILDWEIV